MNLKVKNTIIPHGQPGILIPLDKARPIFQEVVGVNSIVGELDVDDPTSNQHDSNPTTATPLLRWLSTMHNLIDFAEKAFAASESKNTSKKVETHNLKLQI